MPKEWSLEELEKDEGKVLKCSDDVYLYYQDYDDTIKRLYDPELDLKLESLDGVMNVIGFADCNKEEELSFIIQEIDSITAKLSRLTIHCSNYPMLMVAIRREISEMDSLMDLALTNREELKEDRTK